jgi:hypothetical protein
VSTNGGATFASQALTTSPTWYKVISSVAVSDPVLAIENNNLSPGVVANVCAVAYVKH